MNTFIKNEEYEFMYNLIYNEFKYLLDLSNEQWIELFKKFTTIINE